MGTTEDDVVLNVRIPKQLVVNEKFNSVIIEEGISILLVYEEFPLREHTFTLEREDNVTCKAHKCAYTYLQHDFKYHFSNYYTDCSTDFSHYKSVVRH